MKPLPKSFLVSSLFRSIVAFELLWSLPMAVILLWPSTHDLHQTFRVILTLAILICGGLFLGAVMWFQAFKPMNEKVAKLKMARMGKPD